MKKVFWPHLQKQTKIEGRRKEGVTNWNRRMVSSGPNQLISNSDQSAFSEIFLRIFENNFDESFWKYFWEFLSTDIQLWSKCFLYFYIFKYFWEFLSTDIWFWSKCFFWNICDNFCQLISNSDESASSEIFLRIFWKQFWSKCFFGNIYGLK